MVVYIFLAVLGSVILSVFVMLMIGVAVSGPRYRGAVSDHFDGSKFFEPRKDKAEGRTFRLEVDVYPQAWAVDGN